MFFQFLIFNFIHYAHSFSGHVVPDSHFGCTKRHTIQERDTCDSISLGNNIPTQSLMETNNALQCDSLRIGQVVCIASTLHIPNCAFRYNLKEGDDCSKVSIKFELELDAFKVMNLHIECSDNVLLFRGQPVCIKAQNSTVSIETHVIAQPVESINSTLVSDISDTIKSNDILKLNSTVKNDSIEQKLDHSKHQKIASTHRKHIKSQTRESHSPRYENDKDDVDYITEHNRYRASQGIAGLTIDHSLAASSLRHAKFLASNGQCTLQHDKTNKGKFGENLASAFYDLSFNESIGLWYDEVDDYVHGVSPLNHYTQVMWRDSERVGCASYTNGCTAVVCRYFPPGNVVGQHPFL